MQPRLPKPQPKRLSLPRRPLAPAKLWHFSSLHGSSRAPLFPHPCAWLPPASRGRWSHAARQPRAGPPRYRDRGVAPAPSTQPLPAQRPRQHGRPKMSPWQPCGTLACFPSFGQRGGVVNSVCCGPGASPAVAPGWLAHMARAHVPLLARLARRL